jgi:pimeloyl-ACP methyl ester carboxylesterase
MTGPRLNHVQCLGARGLHRMAYWEWGDERNPHAVVCVHGLTRQGRGESDWLADPAGYAVPAYVADMVTLLARVNATDVHWVGTSMGGLIGMGLASLKGNPLRSLVLNDVGPALEFAALTRIGEYVGLPLHFATVEEGAAYLQSISAGFGPHGPAQWLALSRPQLRGAPQGGFRMHYDPAIGTAFKAITPAWVGAANALGWHAYDAIHCSTLLLRGADSDLLTRDTALAMTQRGPRPRLVEFPGVGHAPMLSVADQVTAVVAFLEAQRAA